MRSLPGGLNQEEEPSDNNLIIPTRRSPVAGSARPPPPPPQEMKRFSPGRDGPAVVSSSSVLPNALGDEEVEKGSRRQIFAVERDTSASASPTVGGTSERGQSMGMATGTPNERSPARRNVQMRNNFIYESELTWGSSLVTDCCAECDVCCMACCATPFVYVENLNTLAESKTGYKTSERFTFFIQYVCAWSCLVIFVLNMMAAFAYAGIYAVNYIFFVAMFMVFVAFLGQKLRAEIMDKYGITTDVSCPHCLCHLCAVCQETRFLRAMTAEKGERVRTYLEYAPSGRDTRRRPKVKFRPSSEPTRVSSRQGPLGAENA